MSIFMKNLKSFWDEDTLRQIFGEFGRIVSCKVVKNKHGDARYGFVHFERPESAQKAIRAVNGRPVKGNLLIVERKGLRTERESPEDKSTVRGKLFVKNLTVECNTVDKLRQLFGPFGYVSNVWVRTDKKDRPGDYGFVLFAESSAAQRARAQLDGWSVASGKRLIVRPFYTKRHYKLMKTFIECQVCTEKTSLDKVVSYGCQHQFCRQCAADCLKTEIEGGTLERLVCPDTDCQQKANRPLIKRLVSEELFHRYENLLEKDATRDMAEIINCPNAKCDGLIQVNILLAHCHTCQQDFCSNCLKRYHGHWNCHTANDRWNPTRLLVEVNQQLMSEDFITLECKRCPKCNAPIQKNKGCNHMTCRMCLHDFCWIDLADWANRHYWCRDKPQPTSFAAAVQRTDPMTAPNNVWLEASRRRRETELTELANAFPPLLDTITSNANHL